MVDQNMFNIFANFMFWLQYRTTENPLFALDY